MILGICRTSRKNIKIKFKEEMLSKKIQIINIKNLRDFFIPFVLCLLIYSGFSAEGAANEFISPPAGQTGYAQAERFLPANATSSIFNASVNPHWISGTQSFWYLRNSRNGQEFMLVDIQNRSKSPAFNHTSLAADLSSAKGEPVDPSHLPFSEITVTSEGLDGIEKIGFEAFNRSWQFTFNNTDAQLIEMPSPPRPEPAEILSPDGMLAAYVRDHNLWVRYTDTVEKSQLTFNGTKDYAYAERSETVSHPVTLARLNETAKPYAVWSPDSTRIATFRMDQRNVSDMHLLQYVPGNATRSRPWSYRFATPGDEILPMYEPVVVDVAQKKIIAVQSPAQPEVSLMDTEDDVLQWWSDDGRTLYSLYAQRGEKALQLLQTDPVTGKTEMLLEEKGSTFLEANLNYASPPNIRILKSGNVIWFSEKDGYGHLYLYGPDGKEKNAITSGNWAVRSLLYVDENTSQVFFLAGGREAGRDPYYLHLHRISLNGSGLQLLSPEDADHNVVVDPTGTAFLDTYSTVEEPPVSVIRNRNGSIIMNLETADIQNLKDTGWMPPERFSVKALDGQTDLYGLLFKPTSFNASKKYPIVETVYPGLLSLPSRFRLIWPGPIRYSGGLRQLQSWDS